MTASQQEVADAVRNLVEAGAPIAGNAIGAGLGFLIGGPGGAAIGAGVGAHLSHALRSAGDEICKHLLGPRERTRLGAALAFAADDIQMRLKRGEQPRSDGFFDPDASGRSTAEEITEGVLLAAQREYEERKIWHLGALLAELSFDPTYDRSFANYLISLAERLTYTQYVILAVIARNQQLQQLPPSLRDRMKLRDTRYPGITDRRLSNVLTQTLELVNIPALYKKGEIIAGIGSIIPADLRLQGVGATLWNTLKLSQLDQDAQGKQEFEYVWKLLLREGASIDDEYYYSARVPDRAFQIPQDQYPIGENEDG